jgi:molybdate transport system substrate-binding protein
MLGNLSRAPGFSGDYHDRVLRNVVSFEENVRGVVAKVQLGEADAGVVYRTDVTPAVARMVRTLEIPRAFNVMASYPIAVTRNAPAPAAARRFVDFVRSTPGRRILRDHGFEPAEDGS